MQKILLVAMRGGEAATSAPKSVEVRVFQDDVLVGAYTPVYSESFPNGPDCGPGCVSAESVMLALN